MAPLRLMVRTQPFHGWNMSSNLIGLIFLLPKMTENRPFYLRKMSTGQNTATFSKHIRAIDRKRKIKGKFLSEPSIELNQNLFKQCNNLYFRTLTKSTSREQNFYHCALLKPQVRFDKQLITNAQISKLLRLKLLKRRGHGACKSLFFVDSLKRLPVEPSEVFVTDKDFFLLNLLMHELKWIVQFTKSDVSLNRSLSKVIQQALTCPSLCLSGIRVEVKGFWKNSDRTQKKVFVKGALYSQKIDTLFISQKDYVSTKFGKCGVMINACFV